MAPLSKPAHGPARTAARKTASWKKWMDEVNAPSGIGMAMGGRDMTLARAAINATNATILAFISSDPRVLRSDWFVTPDLYAFPIHDSHVNHHGNRKRRHPIQLIPPTQPRRRL